jgi:PAS domain S-box-containing protein
MMRLGGGTLSLPLEHPRSTIVTPEEKVPSLILRLESLDDDAAADSDSGSDTAIDRGNSEAPGQIDVDSSAPAVGAHSLAFWQAAAESSNDACLVLDARGAVVSASPAAIEALGAAGQPVRGRRLLDVIDVVDLDTGASHPDYAVRITPLATLGGRGLMRSLMRLRTPDGSLVTLDSTSAPLHDADGATIGSISFFATFASL